MPQGTRGNPFAIEQRKQIAERLKIVRRSMRNGLGMIQSEMAELVDVSHSHYSKCESGHNTFSARFLHRFADRTGISAAWLLSGTGPMREGEGAPPPAQNECPALHPDTVSESLVLRVIKATRDPQVLAAAQALAQATSCTPDEALAIVIFRRVAAKG